MGKQPHAGDVTDGPQTLTGAQVIVDRDAVGVGVDADAVEAETIDPRTPAGGDEQVVTASSPPSWSSSRHPAIGYGP